MAKAAMAIQKKNLDSPDETRSFDKGKFNTVKIGGMSIGRYSLEPGWRWSKSVKPLVKTESCQVHHIGYVISGRLKVRMDDGSETELGPGDALSVTPGHDAWVVGDKPWVALELQSAQQYGKKGK